MRMIQLSCPWLSQVVNTISPTNFLTPPLDIWKAFPKIMGFANFIKGNEVRQMEDIGYSKSFPTNISLLCENLIIDTKHADEFGTFGLYCLLIGNILMIAVSIISNQEERRTF